MVAAEDIGVPVHLRVATCNASAVPLRPVNELWLEDSDSGFECFVNP